MNRTLLVVLTALFLSSLVVDAVAQSNPLAQPTTPQGFHTVGDSDSDSAPAAPASDPDNTPTSADSSSAVPNDQTTTEDTGSSGLSQEDEAEQMQAIKAIEAKAKAKALANTSTQSTQAMVSPTAPSASVLQALQSQITRLAQLSSSTQQQLSERIDASYEQNDLQAKQLKQLTETQQQIQVVITQLNKQLISQSATKTTVSSGFMPLISLVWLVILSLVVVALIVTQVLSLRTIKRLPRGQDACKELDEEYDFMATQEAMPAKLDLARAYIEMGDDDQAKEVLAGIVASGQPEFVAQAKALLAMISQAKREPDND